MSVIGRIRSVFPSTSSIVTKGLGLAALGVVLKDSHYLGKVQADLYASKKDADSATYFLNNSMYLSDMRKSSEAIKDTADTMGIGYIKGFFSMLVSNVIPLGLGIGAVFGGKAASKMSAVGIAAYAIYRVIRSAFGIGVPNGLKMN